MASLILGSRLDQAIIHGPLLALSAVGEYPDIDSAFAFVGGGAFIDYNIRHRSGVI